MPELLSIHGRCPRCSQVLVVPAGQLQNVFRCARCQYRVLGSALMEEAQRSPPRLARPPVVRPFDEDPDDQHTRLHLPATDGDEEAETALPAQRVGDTPSGVPVASPLQRFGAEPDDPEDQQTRLHVGPFDGVLPTVTRPSVPPPPQRVSAPPPARTSVPPARTSVPPPRMPAPPARASVPPAGLSVPPARASAPPPRAAGLQPGFAQRPPPKHATLLGVPSPARLGRFGEEPDDSDDQATRLALEVSLAEAQQAYALRGQTSRGMPAAPTPAPMPMPVPMQMPPPTPLPDASPLQRFDPGTEEPDDQNTRLQVPIAFEEEPPPRAPAPVLRSPVAPRISLPASEFEVPQPSFGRATLQLSRVIDEWVRERRAVLLITLAALCSIVAPVFDVVLASPHQAATVIAANLALFFSWALAFAWLGKLRNDSGVWDPGVALTRFRTGTRLALDDLRSFGSLPQPLRWRVVAEVALAVGLGGLVLASTLTVTHLVIKWPEGTGLVFLWRLFSGSSIVLAVIARREASNVPVGLSPAPDVTAPAVSHFPAVLDLSLPLSVPTASAATPLHQVLEVLSQWEAREWPNQDSYVAVLERHLLRRMGWARIDRDHPAGDQRGEGTAHLIVDESLLIEVVRGFDQETAERLSARMRRLAKGWRGKPAMIVVFDASRSELLNGTGTPLLEALHQSYPMLAVRMPSASLIAS